MTREEAIKMLGYIRHTGNGESEYKNDAQSIALDMAIKALQAQAEKTCDTCKHSGKNPYTDEPCSECDECMLWEQAQAEPQAKCGACIHHHGELLECDMYGCGFEPKRADGDLISRNNAITSVCQWGTTLERTGTYTITVAKMKQIITDMLCELPTVAIPSAEPYKGMTNGEVIKAVFPNTKIITQYDNPFGDRFMVFELDNKMSQEVYLDWWNSPYKGVAIPSAEPKTGHWIEKPNVYGVAYCSECGYELKINNTNYCPNCGAKMESEG